MIRADIHGVGGPLRRVPVVLGLGLVLAVTPSATGAAPTTDSAASVDIAAARLPLGSPALAETRAVRRLADGVTLTTIRRGERVGDRNSARSRWVVRVLTIDPHRADGHLGVTYGRSLSKPTRTSELTRQVDALVGVNGSYFSPSATRPGDPLGLTMSGGRVLSEPSGYAAETTLLVDSARNTMRVGKVRWSATVRNSTTNRALSVARVNAPPNVPMGCRTAHSHRLCRKPGQLAIITKEFGARTPSGRGGEVLLNSRGCPVKVIQHRGLKLSKGRSSLQATGASARRLRDLAAEGCLTVRHTLRDWGGRRLPVTASTSAIAGRFRLLQDGRIVVPDRNRPLFRRTARTIAGITSDGKILLVTVDGRTTRSIGATLREAAVIARALGMRDAINLDGGSSSTMAVRGQVINFNRGSERPVSDALVWRR